MKRYLGETPMLDYSDENIQQLMEHRKWREKDEQEAAKGRHDRPCIQDGAPEYLSQLGRGVF